MPTVLAWPRSSDFVVLLVAAIAAASWALATNSNDRNPTARRVEPVGPGPFGSVPVSTGLQTYGSAGLGFRIEVPAGWAASSTSTRAWRTR